jgi:hypothetical protein
MSGENLADYGALLALEGVVKRRILHWPFIDRVAARIDDATLRAAQEEKDAVRAYELVYAALAHE